MSLKVAKTWSKVYFTLEVVLGILWSTAIFAFLAALGEEGAYYRINILFVIAHWFLLPSVEYTLQDGDRRILFAYLLVLVTDVALIWEIAGHAPAASKAIEWAFGLSLAVGSLALLNTCIAIVWMLYVILNNIKFRFKGSTEEKPEETGTRIRLRIK
jgi:hypothetical protein